METPKRLRMFAGPNGSGKTSLAMKLAKEFSPDGLFQLHHFVNADNILRDLVSGQGVRFSDSGVLASWDRLRVSFVNSGRLAENHPFLNAARLENTLLTAPAETCDAYVAAAISDFLREAMLAAGSSFSFETVMSHRNKVDFFAQAKAAGYRTYLYFVATESPTLNIHRVANRIEIGGHAVPENKLIERYYRCLELVGDALAQAYRGFLFDNSGTEPKWLAELIPEGQFVLKVPATSLPEWFRTAVMSRYPVR